MNWLNTIYRRIKPTGWLGAMGDNSGEQNALPTVPLIAQAKPYTPDMAMQLSAVWACINVLADTHAGLPLAVYEVGSDGARREARGSQLWQILHSSPNAYMTPSDFWRTMAMNRYLRGNAYARIVRSGSGDLVALIPMAADQVTVDYVGGDVVYVYTRDANPEVIAAKNVLHWKGLGNGFVGLSTLDYMRMSVHEQANAQLNAMTMYGNGNSPVGVLTIDQDLNKRQVEQLKARFSNLTTVAGDSSDWLKVLPADMKFQQISMSPADTQLLETRQFGVDEIGRWFGVPSALINGAGGAPGANIEQAVEAFYRSTIVPHCYALEQAVMRSVLLPEERQRYRVEFKLNALQRASVSARYESYAKALQNGFMTRNEVRRAENMAPLDGADELTAQNNLVPLSMLGQKDASQTPQSELGDPIKQ